MIMKEINKKRIVTILKIVKFLCEVAINHLQGRTTTEEVDQQLAQVKFKIGDVNNQA